jgi:ketosteroid isomerase-like protein
MPLPRLLPALAALLVLGACAPSALPPAAAPTPIPPTTSPAAEIIPMMSASTEAWNRGDLDGFLLPYLDSPALTFVGRNGLVHGKQALREIYRASYWKDGAHPASTLAFRDFEVRPLGANYALAVGRFVLTDRTSGQQTSTGLFSLTMMRTPEGWRIIHDHSS